MSDFNFDYSVADVSRLEGGNFNVSTGGFEFATPPSDTGDGRIYLGGGGFNESGGVISEFAARAYGLPSSSVGMVQTEQGQFVAPSVASAPSVAPTATPSVSAPSSAPPKSALNTIAAVLDTYGLGSLAEHLYTTYAKQEINLNNPDAIMYALKDQPAYQTRFAANTGRRKKGLQELSPSTYVGLEDAYRQLLQANGLPAGFYDGVEDFQKWIEADTSPKELQERIQLGFNKVDRADPEVLRQIKLLYPESGIGDTRESLAMFFLDPVRAAPVLARRAQAAQIGARAYESAGLQLSATTAEGIAARDYTDSQIQSAFSDLGTQAGLLNEIQGEAKLSSEEKLGQAFGYDSTAKLKVERRRATRKAIFSDGGRYTATSGATSGTQESALGGPR